MFNRTNVRRALVACTVLLTVGVAGFASTARPQETANSSAKIELPAPLLSGPEQWTSPEGLSSTIQVMLLLTVLSLAPAVMLMTTCFVRIVVVIGLLRQALGTQQLPPSQVITSIGLFLTLLIMWPVWRQTYDNGVVPYTQRQISLEDAWTRGTKPLRTFMINQIIHCGNDADVWLFYKYLPSNTPEPKSNADVPLVALVPAYMLSELKTAFLIGFQIYLPFVILDLVIASITIGMGMLMLPPVLISLPFKLLLFVLVDGWHLVVEMLMQSFVSTWDPQDAIDLAREAVMITLWISAPVLIVGMVVGLTIGLIQALTQVQEQTVAFVPKLFAMILVLSLTLPWLIAQVVDYTRELYENIPKSL